MNSLGIPSAEDHFETIINVKGSTIDQVYPQVYFMWVPGGGLDKHTDRDQLGEVRYF